MEAAVARKGNMVRLLSEREHEAYRYSIGGKGLSYRVGSGRFKGVEILFRVMVGEH
jgi:hypothetical protein